MKDVNGTMTATAEMYTDMEIGTAVTFYCAVWQVILFFLFTKFKYRFLAWKIGIYVNFILDYIPHLVSK